MPTPTLVTTPGSASANAYCSLAEANTYHDGHVDGATWGGYTDDQKTRAILQATRQLDAEVMWNGTARFSADGQALAWPRAGLIDYTQSGVWDEVTGRYLDDTTIPDRLKWACAEQARLLLSRDRALELEQQAQGLAMVSAGGVTVTFDGTPNQSPVIAPSAWALVHWWGTRRRGSRASGTAILERY